jgi:hypothetical protein
MRLAVEAGHTSGRAVAQNGDEWVCVSWSPLPSGQTAVSIAIGISEYRARMLADQRLAAEVAKH